VERVFDGLALLFFLAVAVLFLPASGLAERLSEAVRLPAPLVAVALVAPFAAATALMVGMALYPEKFRGAALALARRLLPKKLVALADSLLGRFIDGFRDLHRPGRLAALFVLSLPIWLVEGAMYYLIALGFDLDAHFASAWLMGAAVLLVTALSNLATALPSSQGSVGPFEFFAALSLEFLGVGSGLALAYALVLHTTLLVPVTVAGLAHLAVKTVDLGQLTRGAQLARPAAEASAPVDQAP